ncbi:hypothetical protein DFJ74DRAFT_644236 [Hyaloraphidium curvatum]|nr:hypothetical protein DFJ74DRAFT_644236 [Hyaloraphidium curvatum]
MTQRSGRTASVDPAADSDLQLRGRLAPDENPEDLSLASLPPEVLLLIMERVLCDNDEGGKKKSLLKLLSTCRRLLWFGSSTSCRTPGSLRPPRFGTQHRNRLGGPFPRSSPARRRPVLVSLKIEIVSFAGFSDFLRGIDTANALERVSVSYVFYGIRINTMQTERTLVQHLDKLGGTFKDLELQSTVEFSHWARSNLKWPREIQAFSAVAANLHRLTINTGELDGWTAYVFENVRMLEVTCFESAAEAPKPNDVRRIRAAFPALETLFLHSVQTSIMAGCEWKGLKRVDLLECFLGELPLDAFDAIEAAVGETDIYIEPFWDVLIYPGGALSSSHVLEWMDEESDWSYAKGAFIRECNEWAKVWDSVTVFDHDEWRDDWVKCLRGGDEEHEIEDAI